MSSPLVAKLTGKAVQVVHIILGTHHHLKGRDELATRSTVSRYTKQPRTINIFFLNLRQPGFANRETANPCFEGIHTQCLMMFINEFCLSCIHIFSEIYPPLTSPDETYVPF